MKYFPADQSVKSERARYLADIRCTFIITLFPDDGGTKSLRSVGLLFPADAADRPLP